MVLLPPYIDNFSRSLAIHPYVGSSFHVSEGFHTNSNNCLAAYQWCLIQLASLSRNCTQVPQMASLLYNFSTVNSQQLQWQQFLGSDFSNPMFESDSISLCSTPTEGGFSMQLPLLSILCNKCCELTTTMGSRLRSLQIGNRRQSSTQDSTLTLYSDPQCGMMAYAPPIQLTQTVWVHPPRRLTISLVYTQTSLQVEANQQYIIQLVQILHAFQG